MDNNKIRLIQDQIESTRKSLNELIVNKEYNLLDLEVIQLSKALDELLSEYESLLK